MCLLICLCPWQYRDENPGLYTETQHADLEYKVENMIMPAAEDSKATQSSQESNAQVGCPQTEQ